MNVPDEDIVRTTELLRKYFDNDSQKRFRFERYIGGGTNALTWKLKYRMPEGSGAFERIVVKMDQYIAFFDENAPAQEEEDHVMSDVGSEEPNMWTDPNKNEARGLKVRYYLGATCVAGQPALNCG